MTYWGHGLSVVVLLALLYGVLTVISGTPGAPYATAALISLPLFIGPQLVLALVERGMAPAGPRKSRANWILHLKIHIWSAIFESVMTCASIVLVQWLAQSTGLRMGLFDLRVAEGEGPLHLVLALVLATLIADFFFYWMHRTMHKNAFLWQHHKLHHMDRHFDALTSWRQNWIEWPINVVCIGVPTILLFRLDNLDPFALGLLNGTLIFLLSSLRLINHFNVKIEFGPASRLVAGPQVHRIHHSYMPQHQDKNFSAYFPVWDILFGTYFHPGKGEFPPTGVEGEGDIAGFWESQIFTQKEWWKYLRAKRRTPALISD